MFFLLQKIHRFVFALSAWRFILAAAGGIAVVLFVWAAVDGHAAAVMALVLLLLAFLFWLANQFRL